MRRRLLTVLSALSLLLCVAVVALWVFSYFRIAIVVRFEQNAPMDLELSKGWVAFQRAERPPALRLRSHHPGAGFSEWRYECRPYDEFARLVTHRRDLPKATSRVRAVVFEVYQHPAARIFTVTTVRVPLWVLTALTAALPLSRLWSRRRRRRAKNNLCPACGYDLTANVSGTCPECGRPTGRGKDGAEVAAHSPVADRGEGGNIHAV